MPSLSFPDLNVWLPLVVDRHVHREAALSWWENEDGAIAFSRFTQMGLLRLLTTPAVMNAQPLSMEEAWRVYDRLLEDDRVCLLPEPEELESVFRERSRGGRASPKLWADAYLMAFAEIAGAALVTFDHALAERAKDCILL